MSVLTYDGQAEWEVWLQDVDGLGLDVLDYALEWECNPVVNDRGTFSATLPFEYMKKRGYLDLPPDMRLEFRRAPYGQSLQTVMAGYVRRLTEDENEIKLEGFGFNDLLARRIVAYKANSAQAKMTNELDDMMKQIVRENLGSSATDSDRNLTTYGLTVQADQALGASKTVAFAYKYVLETLQKLSFLSTFTGTKIYFDIVPNGAGLQFRTYPGQRGGLKIGEVPTFSQEFGNLQNPVYVRDFTNMASVVYVAGMGAEDVRDLEEVEDTSLSVLSRVNRVEIFKDASTTPKAELVVKGQEELQKWRPVHRFTGTLLDTPQARFQQEWNFGDRVTVGSPSRTFNAMIGAVKLKMRPGGQESITANYQEFLA